MPEQPIITIFCSFTRLGLLSRWLSDLDHLDIDPSRTNLAFIVDGCSKDVENPEKEAKQIYARLMDYINHRHFRGFKIVRNEGHLVNEVNIPVRRQRIAEIKNQSKQLIIQLDGTFVLGLEDDTVFDKCSVQKMLYIFQNGLRVGMVTAYEAGRWYAKMIGIWSFDNVKNSTYCRTLIPPSYRSPDLPDDSIEPIEAAGFYFYLTPTPLYLKHDYHTEVWQPWGPDCNYGLWLRQQGYVNIVDWSQPCGHNLGDIVVDRELRRDVIIEPSGNLITEQFIKKGHNEWHRVKQNIS